MEKTLALIHTTLVFVTVETMMKDLMAEILKGVRLVNIVDDSLLPDVMKAGRIEPPVVERMRAYLKAAELAGADAVLSLCSSLGPAVDAVKGDVRIPVIKIDEAMAGKAAAEARRIGVMATVPTTLGPTVALIGEKAAGLGREAEVKERLVAGAFKELMDGNRAGHDDMVFKAAKELASGVDLIAFAQASMTRLGPRVAAEIGKPVLTSPRLGIEHARRVLDSLG